MFLFIQLIHFMLQVFAMAKFILETKEIIMINVVKKKNIINVKTFFLNILFYIPFSYLNNV